jgi:hypothetical protein
MTEIIAGVRVPNSRVVDDVTELIRETTSELIFHHSRRVFLFGSRQARRLHIEPDPPDELEHFVPGFHRIDVVDVINDSAWPE